MAFIEKTAFEARITNNDRENLSHIAGLYKAGEANADCSAGLLCVRKGQIPCEGFTGVYNENTWYMKAATTADNAESVIYACDTYDVQLLPGKGGKLFAVGAETDAVPRGASPCRFSASGKDIPMLRRFKNATAGSTLVEVVVAITILGLVCAPICSSLVLAARVNQRSSQVMAAQLSVSNAVEQLMAEGIPEDKNGNIYC